MKTLLIRILSVGLLAASASCSSQAAAPVASIPCRGRAAMISQTLKVEAIDAAHRGITLKSPEGGSASFLVGEDIKRFNEIKVGDSLVVQYHVGVIAEMREPSAEEKAAPVKTMEGVSRAPSDVPPAGALTRSVRVVTTIDAINTQAQTITLKGPLGGLLSFKVEEGSPLGGLKVGQTIVATFGEQLVLAILPGGKNQ